MIAASYHLDVKQAITMAHAVGADVLLDGCQAVVNMKVDVRALDVDYYAFTGHKLYGPTGIGVLYGKHAEAGGAAAVRGRGRDDRDGDPRRRHLQRPAASFRGRHAAHRGGHRPRGGNRTGSRRSTGLRSTSTSRRCWRGLRRGPAGRQRARRSTARPGKRAPFCRFRCRGRTRTTSPRSWTVRGSRFAPGIIAPSR